MFKMSFPFLIALSVLLGSSTAQAGVFAILGEWLFKGATKSGEHSLAPSIGRGAAESSARSLPHATESGAAKTMEHGGGEAHGMHMPHMHVPHHSSESHCDSQQSDNC
jgi:hypothetical protein